ncbi:hypothetical protein GCM10011613_20780 [Cellvibrio zantedeschiae]|uniref:Uncharacterized protein n=1 Tax=Cellvibrio zantedeschiae TaxID=1237077 RepID=A0ABQ3B201_9GAMM|nr:hypothetical protein [Cellvibrio zantedeschiae]GGY75124.1 hypothetical protein GCM10011613_20780 [Cellvibrio zantedeschiae]
MMRNIKTVLLGGLLLSSPLSHADFFDDFNNNSVEGWQTFTGDGDAKLKFLPMDGFARMQVDATKDQHNIYWTIIKRDVSKSLDMEKLKSPDYELRVEARVRPSASPRRVNFMINTQRTTDFHEHLREYDLGLKPDWQVISMTTRNFDAVPGDQVNVQLSVTDWGLGEHYLDVDYYRAEVVKVKNAKPDVGEPLVYHPPIPALDTFKQHVKVKHDATINSAFPLVNFNNWKSDDARVLTVSAGQYPLLRWDLQNYSGKKAKGAGVLELTTQSVQKGGDYIGALGEDFGIEFDKVRVFEILGGDTNWQQNSVTFASFTQGKDLQSTINGQMIFDTDVAQAGGKTLVTIPRPVMQRIIDGTTHGLLLQPLGALEVSFYDSEHGDGSQAPKLHFSTRAD